MLSDQFGHAISVDKGGIQIGGADSITSHFLQFKGRTPLDFAQRVEQLMGGRGVSFDFGTLLHDDERNILLEAISLEREVYAGILRRSTYFDKNTGEYSDERREYHTHTEGVVELIANFLPEMNIPREYVLIVLVVGLFHDGIEDASREMKIKIAQFLRKYFPKKYGEIIETLFALTHPNLNLYAEENEAIFFPDATAEKGRVEAAMSESKRLAEKIHLDVLRRSHFYFESWKLGFGTNHNLPFRAPKDGTFSGFISSGLGNDRTAIYTLNNDFGFDVRRIRLLYRFAIHCYHIWWLQHERPQSMNYEEKFFQRVEGDLASMIQVSFYSVRRPSENGVFLPKTLAEQLTIPIKLADNTYNAWDNDYLQREKNDRESKIFKAMMLSFRARYYQELLMQVLGQNSPFHNVTRATTKRLDNEILMPIAHEALGGKEYSDEISQE